MRVQHRPDRLTKLTLKPPNSGSRNSLQSKRACVGIKGSLTGNLQQQPRQARIPSPEIPLQFPH